MKAFGASDLGVIDAAHAASITDRRSLAQGLFIFITYTVLYAATLIDALAPFPVALNVAFGIGNGICIAMLFIVGHDCCHGAFVPGRRWKSLAGTLRVHPGCPFCQPLAARP